MCKSSDPLLLVRFKAEINGNRDERDPDQNDANQITQRQTANEPQRKHHWDPNNDFAQVWLHEDQKTWRTRNRSGEQ